MDRRTFLGSITMLGLAGLADRTEASALARMAGKKTGKKGIDENLVVFISDLHTKKDNYEEGKLKRVLADILAMRPLPKNVIVLGDLAFLTGKPEEYATLKPMLAPLEEAGITLTLGMGNHDRRENFAACFPEHHAKSVFPDRETYVVETPRADFIVLDSLIEGDDTTTWITPGSVNDAQKEWLTKTLASYTKPVFVCAHHPINETQINEILVGSPTCCGYVFGHRHRWLKDWIRKNYSSNRIVRTLCIPSTGHDSDIGYVTFRLEEDKAVAKVHEYEFYFPHPAKEGTRPPVQWEIIAKENDGDTCTFSYEIAK